MKKAEVKGRGKRLTEKTSTGKRQSRGGNKQESLPSLLHLNTSFLLSFTAGLFSLPSLFEGGSFTLLGSVGSSYKKKAGDGPSPHASEDVVMTTSGTSKEEKPVREARVCEQVSRVDGDSCLV